VLLLVFVYQIESTALSGARNQSLPLSMNKGGLTKVRNVLHTDVSAEKLLRDARMAGLVKLRRGIQRTGQRRLRAVCDQDRTG
jgi:hypothetical protein